MSVIPTTIEITIYPCWWMRPFCDMD